MPASSASRSSRLQGAWAKLQDARTFLQAHTGRLTRRIIFIGLRLLLVGLLLFGVALAVLRYAVLPNVAQYRERVEQTVARQLDLPVTIGSLSADWRGLRPRLLLTDLRIARRDGAPGLHVPQASATVGWLTVLHLAPRLHSLVIESPALDVRRDTDNRWSVAGIAIEPSGPTGDRSFGDLLLEQREILVRNALVRYVDERTGAAPLELRDVHITIRNGGLHHEFGFVATPPADLATRIDMRAAFRHAPFARDSSDWRAWKGELYADFGQADLGRIARTLPVLEWAPGSGAFEINRGHGALRAWLALDHGRVDKLTADVELDHLALRWRPDLPMLDVADAKGRIVARELSARELDGGDAYGHEITLTGFGFRTAAGMVLPPTDALERLVFDAQGQVRQGSFSTRSIELDALTALIEHLPLGRNVRDWLARHAPRGRVSDFSYAWTGPVDAPSVYSLKAAFTRLALNAQPAAAPHALGRPGFENLAGTIESTQAGGRLQLDATQAALAFPGLFANERVEFDRLFGRAEWKNETDGALSVRIPAINFSNADASGSVQGSYGTAGKGGMGTVDLQGRVTQARADAVHRYLPLSLPETTRNWVGQAIKSGRVEQALFRVRGDLRDFPFARAEQGEFRVIGKVRDARINLVPTETRPDGISLWPELTDVRGDLVFERNGFMVADATARTAGLAVKGVNVRMADFANPRHLIEASAQATGPLREVFAYVNASPVGGWLGGFLSGAAATGDTRMNLKLAIPLAAPRESTVRGDLALVGNDITLSSAIPTFQRAAGRLEFTETGATLRNVMATFLGGPLKLEGGPRPDGATVLRGEGVAFMAQLKRELGHPVFDRARGQARFNAQVVVDKGAAELNVDSNLVGAALDLPAPLRKTADEALPFRFDIVPTASATEREQGRAREEWRFSLGSALSAAFERARTAAEQPMRVARAAIGVNAPAELAGPGTVGNVRLKTVDFDAWQTLLGADADANADARAAPESAPVPGGPGLVATKAESASFELPEPFIFNIRADTVNIAGKRFDEVVAGATQFERIWAISVDSRQAEGALQWRRATASQPAGRLIARLTRLQLQQAQANDVVELLDRAPAQDLPALDIAVDRFKLGQVEFGRLEMEANNVGEGRQQRWELSRLLLASPEGRLNATGAWGRDARPSATINRGSRERVMQLEFALDVDDVGAYLDRLGFKGTLRGGNAKLEGKVSWRGSPFALDTPSLNGDLKLAADKGQFLRVEPGVGRLLGVMSLQSLPRRLSFDFRDLFSAGFAFDTIRASSSIVDGIATTTDFRMRGAGATALIEGKVDFTRETQDLHVVVLPELDATGASVAYGFLVNPAIGLGTFLAQLLLKDPLSKALANEYKVTGPWNEPQVERIQRKPDTAASPAAG
ncbi:MAG TPA: YhdP family protein [Burkholderiaceae bacterium]|nr:YhdP family protein [Burkholderiaceae bacterium]